VLVLLLCHLLVLMQLVVVVQGLFALVVRRRLRLLEFLLLHRHSSRKPQPQG
jgi:hypothetical protein